MLSICTIFMNYFYNDLLSISFAYSGIVCLVSFISLIMFWFLRYLIIFLVISYILVHISCIACWYVSERWRKSLTLILTLFCNALNIFSSGILPLRKQHHTLTSTIAFPKGYFACLLPSNLKLSEENAQRPSWPEISSSHPHSSWDLTLLW